MLIYLNGTSSSGKSLIAVELQKQIQQSVIYFSIDTLLYALSSEDLEALMGKRPYRFPFKWEPIMSGYFSCIEALINTGNVVIADCPVYDERLYEYYTKYLSNISNKINIKLSCSLEVLERRERERKDRAIGIAKRQFNTIHNFLKYDLEIQSEALSPLESAEKILKIFLAV